MRLLPLALLALLLAGCGDPLPTEYGTTDGQSVNGVSALKAEWERAFGKHEAYRLSSKLESCDLLIHVCLGRELPAKSSCDWIRSWLEGDDGRQFVLVLHDDNVAAWLCRRWAAEARAEAAKADPDTADHLAQLADHLERRAQRETETPEIAPGASADCGLFHLAGIGGFTPRSLIGTASGAAPATMSLRSEPSAKGGGTLIAADDGEGHMHDWAMALPIGGSRLVVCANATPLLDGALVDRDARRLLGGLIDELRDWRSRAGSEGSAGWLRGLAVREKDLKPPNILALLFGRPPISWVVAHLCALTLIVLAFRGTWLGRVSAPPAEGAERFSRHVDALAWHLRQAAALKACAGALAAHAGRALEAIPTSLGEAREIAASLHRPQTAKHRRRAPTSSAKPAKLEKPQQKERP